MWQFIVISQLQGFMHKVYPGRSRSWNCASWRCYRLPCMGIGSIKHLKTPVVNKYFNLCKRLLNDHIVNIGRWNNNDEWSNGVCGSRISYVQGWCGVSLAQVDANIDPSDVVVATSCPFQRFVNSKEDYTTRPIIWYTISNGHVSLDVKERAVLCVSDNHREYAIQLKVNQHHQMNQVFITTLSTMTRQDYVVKVRVLHGILRTDTQVRLILQHLFHQI